MSKLQAINMSEEMEQQVATLASSPLNSEVPIGSDLPAMEEPLEIVTYQDDLDKDIPPLKCLWEKSTCC